MRKFFIILLILLLSGSAVFYIGWISFQIGPNQYGVVFSKTNGWEPSVVRAGNFCWCWQKLIPTNVSMYIYEPSIQHSNLSIEQNLPSGEHYSQYMEGNPDFTYSIELSVEWNVDPELLPNLAAQREILPENLAELEESLESSVSQNIRTELTAMMRTAGQENTQPILSEIETNLAQKVSIAMREVNIQSIRINNMSFPDIELYEAGREIYQELLESRRAAIQQASTEIVFDDMMTERQLNALQTYGKVITDYPLLLDYFSLSVETGADPLGLNKLSNDGR